MIVSASNKYYFTVHKKFSSSKDVDKEDTIFYFRSNHSLVESDFQGRVFPKDTFSVVFSQSRAQDVQALTFTFSPAQTTVTGLESQTWNENSIFEFGSLNDFTISFSNNSIVFSNIKTEASIAISGGIYEELRFIGFHSDILTTWVLLESTARLTDLSAECHLTLNIFQLSPEASFRFPTESR